MERADLFKAVDEHLARLAATPAAPTPATRYGAWHTAAAVLHTFDERLKPAPIPGPDESIDDVLGSATAIQMADGAWRYKLNPDVRRAVLRQLGNRTAIAKAREANPGAPEDAIQQCLDAYIHGSARPVDEQNERELAATFEVVAWLHGVLDNVPEQAVVRAALDRIYLLAPFEGLVKKNFAGRKEELTALRDYVGVLPGSSWSWLKQQAAEFASWHEKPPLVIFGPGGIGKSTLVGKFVLEHAKVEEEKRFPFVYLDFDRADLVAAEPLTILLEAVRQIGIQWPGLSAECDALRRRWTQQIVRGQQRGAWVLGRSELNQSTVLAQQAPTAVTDRRVFIGDIERFMARPEIANRPVLLVLDTFEEVQSRSQAAVEQITAFLEDLQRAVPRLRTVFSGRAPLEESPASPDRSARTQPMPLSQLDPQSAAAILRMDGMPEPLASKTASWVGGHPLVLQLAADLLRRLRTEHGDDAGLAKFEADAARAQLQEGGVQRFLYTRILDHIKNADPRVSALAHPGLVLRRLTPELILNVLADPCGVAVADLDDAERLLASLSSEVALVTSVGPREVRHRPDLRKLMLKAMRTESSRKDVIERIHQLAVTFYADEYVRTGAAIDRAEELYHRLALDQPPDVLESRWLEAAQPLLFTVADELPPTARAWLSAKLRVELDAEARTAATIEVWERDAERRASEFLIFNQPQRALDVLHERETRTGASPLFVIEARALEAMGDAAAASDVIDAAIEQTFRAGADDVRLDVLLCGADIERRRGELAKSAERLDSAETLARQRGDLLAQLRLAGARLALLDAGQSSDGDTVRGAVAATGAELIERLSDRELLLAPESARSVAAEIVHRNLQTVRRVLRVAGLGTLNLRRLADLARAIERWDADLAAARDRDQTRRVNTVALRKVLEQSYSREQLMTLARRARRRSPFEIGDPSVLAASEAPALTMIAMFERANALPHLVETMEAERQGVAAPVYKSIGPVGRLFDLQNSPDGTIASLILETPTLVPASLDRVFEQLAPPPSVLDAVAAALREQDAPVEEPQSSAEAADLRLTLQQQLAVESALLGAFPSYARFRYLSLGSLGVNLESIAAAGKPLGQVVTDLVQWAMSSGRLVELLSAANRANPDNVTLRETIASIGLTPEVDAGASAGITERLRGLTLGGSSATAVDAVRWREHLAQLESRVCLVRVSNGDAPPIMGTGFLVSEDIVLTSRVLLGDGARETITGSCLFDHREGAGSVADPGSECLLSTLPIVDEDELGEYALLRLSRPIGHEPPGGVRALPGARPRGWVLLEAEHSVHEGTAVIILQNIASGSLRVGVGSDARVRGTALEYRVPTEPGASGAPVFDQQFQLIAIHQGRGSSWLWNVKRGTTIATVVERLRTKGVFDLLRRHPPASDDLAL